MQRTWDSYKQTDNEYRGFVSNYHIKTSLKILRKIQNGEFDNEKELMDYGKKMLASFGSVSDFARGFVNNFAGSFSLNLLNVLKKSFPMILIQYILILTCAARIYLKDELFEKFKKTAHYLISKARSKFKLLRRNNLFRSILLLNPLSNVSAETIRRALDSIHVDEYIHAFNLLCEGESTFSLHTVLDPFNIHFRFSKESQEFLVSDYLKIKELGTHFTYTLKTKARRAHAALSVAKET